MIGPEVKAGDELLGYWVSLAADASNIAQLLGPLLVRLREREVLSGELTLKARITRNYYRW